MVEYVYALHDFFPEHEDEVSFRAGERIEVIEKDDQYGDGWWQVSPSCSMLSTSSMARQWGPLSAEIFLSDTLFWLRMPAVRLLASATSPDDGLVDGCFIRRREPLQKSLLACLCREAT